MALGVTSMCPHIWFFAIFGHIIIRKCAICKKTQFRSCDDEEWTDVQTVE